MGHFILASTFGVEILVFFVGFEVRVEVMNLTKFVDMVVVFVDDAVVSVLGELKSPIDITKLSVLIFVKSEPVGELMQLLFFTG